MSKRTTVCDGQLDLFAPEHDATAPVFPWAKYYAEIHHGEEQPDFRLPHAERMAWVSPSGLVSSSVWLAEYRAGGRR